MKIVVVGCGKIGTVIIANLVSEGHDVVGVDSSSEAIREITEIFDVMCVCGNGVDCKTLSEAGIEEAELFVAVTGSDEFNMLSCYLAHKMGAKHTVARIRNPEYNDQSLGFLRQQLGISVPLNPEQLVAREIYNILRMPGVLNIETFSGRNFEMVELSLKEGSPLDDVQLMQIRKKFSSDFLIGAVQRDDTTYIPDGSFTLKAGDKISIAGMPNEIIRLLKQLGVMQKKAHNIMILGASRTAYYLAKTLLSGGHNVKIIEKDKERCVQFSERLPKASIILGDGTEQEVLLEEGIKSMDAFVALTGMDEQNVLISLFAASHNVPKVVAKVTRSEIARTASKLGLECILSPKKCVTDVIARYSRALENSLGSKVERLYKIMDEQAEALEFLVGGDFPFANIPLKELSLKKNTLIAGITRDRKTIIPSGDDVILPNDKIIVLTTDIQMRDLADMMQ